MPLLLIQKWKKKKNSIFLFYIHKNLGHCVSSVERQPCQRKRSRVKNAWHSMRADRFEWLHIYCVFVAQAQASLPSSSSSSNIDFECGKTKRNMKKMNEFAVIQCTRFSNGFGSSIVKIMYTYKHRRWQWWRAQDQELCMFFFSIRFYTLDCFCSLKLKNNFWRTHINHTMSCAHECFHYWRS